MGATTDDRRGNGTRLDARFPDTRFLDGLRGLAALYVVVHHADQFLRRGYTLQLQSFGRLVPAAAHPLLYGCLTAALSLFRWGHAAVLFFFVLSGFVIHLRYAKQLAADRLEPATFEWGDYVRRRFRRIYPPLLFALLLTTLLDFVGMRLGLPNYTGSTPYLWLNGFVPDHRLATLWGNLLLVGSIYVPWWGTDLPLWSLTFEWWFYMLYPLLWWGSRRSIKATTIAVILFAAVTLLPIKQTLLLQRVLGALPAWWLGALLADVYTGRIRIAFARLSPLTLLLIPALAIPSLPEWAQSDLLALAFAGLISLLFWLQQRGHNLRASNALKPLGDFSYTLYVTHMPVLIFASGMLLAHHRMLPDAPWAMLGGIALALGFAWCAHWWIEVPFTRSAPRRRGWFRRDHDTAAAVRPRPASARAPAAGWASESPQRAG